MTESDKEKFILEEEKESQSQEQTGDLEQVGRISTHLTEAIAYDRIPQLFDTEEMKKRDESLFQASMEIKEADITLKLFANGKGKNKGKVTSIRNGKPVYFTPLQQRIVYALSMFVSGLTEDEDIKTAIEKPLEDVQIIRDVNITELCKLIYGSTKQRLKDNLRREFRRLAAMIHFFFFKFKDEFGDEREYKVTRPIIMIPEEIKEITKGKDKDSEDSLDIMRIQFGKAFFLELNRRFALLTSSLFEVWREGKKGELWGVLLSSILSVYWQYITSYRATEQRIWKEERSLPKEARHTHEELKQRIEEEKIKALTYELNFSSIKKRVAVDYSSERRYKLRFIKDLEEAIEDFKKIDLIKEGQITKGRTEEKVVFVLSETYNSKDKGESNLLPSPPQIT